MKDMEGETLFSLTAWRGDRGCGIGWEKGAMGVTYISRL